MSELVDLNKVYFILAPDFIQRRDNKHLLIWSILPYWKIVTEQEFQLLTCFNGKNTLEQILNKNQPISNTSRQQLETIIKSTTATLLKARVLSDKPNKLVLNDYNNNTYSTIEEITVALSDENFESCLLSPEELRSFNRNISKYVKNNSLLLITATKPEIDIQKVVSLITAATYKGLNTILNFPPESYVNQLTNELIKRRVHLQFTLDGPNPSINDAIQGEGRFEKVINTIKTLINKKFYIILSINSSEHNFQETKQFLNIATELKVNECRIIPLKKIGKYKDYRAPDYREIINTLSNIINKQPAYIKLLGRDIFSILEQLISHNEHKAYCSSGKGQVYLSPDGTIYPCIGYKIEAFKCGNIKETSFDEIWENSPILNRIRQEHSIQSCPQCTRCVIKYWCGGGCRAESFINTDSRTQPALSCSSIKLAFIDLFWQLADSDEIIKPKQPYC